MFNYFRTGDLQITGIDPSVLMISADPGADDNISLPDGTYRLCITVHDISTNQDITTPGTGCITFTIRCRPNDAVTINTAIPSQPPGGLNPIIDQSISAGDISTNVAFNNLSPVCQLVPVKILGKIERLSPSPITITPNPSYVPQSFFVWGQPASLSAAQQRDALANLSLQNLAVTGIDPAALQDPNNPSALRLPDGNYRICFSARYMNSNGTLGGEASNANLGCAMFTICTVPASAPQFTQPVNTLAMMSSSVPVITPTSPVIFTWTPPQTVCGTPRSDFSYDLEIRELLDNQAVIDAINNPFVFQKTALPSTTFILDTNLYRGVLQVGKRYAIRVRAVTASALDRFSIDNNGYSRVEGFQYGNDPGLVIRPAVPIIVRPPEDYYIPFGERKPNQWDDRFAAFQRDPKRDTIIPLQEYIALNLTQGGIAYNPDAIELFMTLNPQLANLKQLRLSTPSRLPDFPEIPPAEQQRFDQQYTASLAPEPNETVRFRSYLDSLRNINLQGQDATITDLAGTLNGFRKNMEEMNRVSANLVNNLMAELVYILQQQAKNKSIDRNHLQEVMANIKDLLANADNTTSFLLPGGKGTLTRLSVPLSLSFAGSVMVNGSREHLPANEKALLPAEVVVWRGSTEPPARPITNAPELKGIYRIFYTTPALYNHKNPEINASSLPDLASTARVPLPKLGRFKFWTLNMKNHKMTKATEVETSDVFLLKNKRQWGTDKKLYVILKVE